MARKRIHGRKKRSPVKSSMYIPPGGSAVDPMTGETISRPMEQPTMGGNGFGSANPQGENQTNYQPSQAQQMRTQQATRLKLAQFEQQQMYQQQQQMQNPHQGGKDGAHSHSHRERTSGLGGIIKSVGRGKGGQSPSPYNSPYNTEEF